MTIAGFGGEFWIPLDPWLRVGTLNVLFSFPEAISAMEEGARAGDFPPPDGHVLCMGARDVSDAATHLIDFGY